MIRRLFLITIATTRCLLPQVPRDELRIVKPGGFTIAGLKQIFAQECSSAPKQGISRLFVGTDRAELQEAATTHAYGGNRDFCSVARSGFYKSPIARLFLFNGSGLASVRQPGNPLEPSIEWIACGKSDPTLFLAGPTTYRMLHYKVNRQEQEAHFYFRALANPSIEEAKQLMKRIEALADVRFYSLDIRLDDWFPASVSFPRIYPFFDPALASSLGRRPIARAVNAGQMMGGAESYFHLPAIFCFKAVGEPVRCNGYNLTQ